MTGDGFPSKRILSEVQYCLDTLLPASGFPIYRIISGSDSGAPFTRVGDGEDLLITQDLSLLGNLAQQCKLRVMAQEDASQGTGDGRLRGLMAYNKSLNCAGAKVGDSVVP